MKIIFSVLLFLFIDKLYALNYYVSAIVGDDTRTILQAQNVNTPWKTISKVNATMSTFKAGDSILFKRGEVFRGSLIITISGTSSGYITFGAFGTGINPEITGFATLSGWVSLGQGIWETTVPTSLTYVNTVTLNGVPQAIGRYPNATATEQGWLHYDSFSNTSITDSKLSSTPTTNWRGAQLVIRKTRWIIDHGKITSQSADKLFFTPQNTGYDVALGYGYFIQNHIATLDQQGEWYFNPIGNKFDIYTGAANPSTYTIKAGVVETLLSIPNPESYLSFENLLFTGATTAAINIPSGQFIHINNCSVNLSGKNAIDIDACDYCNLENTNVSNTLNNAINLADISNSNVSSNTITSTALFPGMADVVDGSGNAVGFFGSNSLFEKNKIDSVGYIGLSFSGEDLMIRNNVISNFTLVKDDGGGIYGGNRTKPGQIVANNIVFNGFGNGNGADNVNYFNSMGIYMDDNTANVQITNNTVFNCTNIGICLHNANNNTVTGNTLYNNGSQLTLGANGSASNLVYANTITGNILFAKDPSQLLLSLDGGDNESYINDFGTFNNNYYYSPTSEDATVSTSGNYFLNLSDWQYFYNQDLNSLKSTTVISSYILTSVVGNNMYSNGTFTSKANDIITVYDNKATSKWNSTGLDGGTLKVAFSPFTSYLHVAGVLLQTAGAITAGHTYRLRFSILGSDAHYPVTSYLRLAGAAGYDRITATITTSVTSIRREREILFTANKNTTNCYIGFDIPEQPNPVYLDNIILEEVITTPINFSDYVTFLYNPTPLTKTYSVNGSDIYGKYYQNNITIQPFCSSIILNSNPNGCLIPIEKPLIINH